jgi:ring-1,2-phenylacetyl-CoA epoxidase subunit PaaD
VISGRPGHEDSGVADAWAVLASVADPEIPVLSVVDLGVIRTVALDSNGELRIGVAPTYSGCPATATIHADIKSALTAAGFGNVVVKSVISPAWTSDWISAEGRAKLRAYGIAPPPPAQTKGRFTVDGANVECPQCGSADTELLSEFGSTPCKALHRCRACQEPFDRFKCI